MLYTEITEKYNKNKNYLSLHFLKITLLFFCFTCSQSLKKIHHPLPTSLYSYKIITRKYCCFFNYIMIYCRSFLKYSATQF